MKARSKTQAPSLWKEHSEAWKASGMTQKAYCEQEAISYRSFIYQHNRLVSQTKKGSVRFIEAKSESAVISSPASGLQVMLPNGIRIGISGDINLVLLQTVLSAAGAVQCLS